MAFGYRYGNPDKPSAVLFAMSPCAGSDCSWLRLWPYVDSKIVTGFSDASTVKDMVLLPGRSLNVSRTPGIDPGE